MFAVQLADRLGFVHVDEMLAQMKWWEFEERLAVAILEQSPQATSEPGIPADDPDFASKVFGSNKAFHGTPR